MTTRHFIAGLLVAAALFAGLPATAGTIEGTVTHAKEKGDVVVYVVKADGKFDPPAKPVTIDQKSMKFVPTVVPVLAGTTVDFLNSDPVNHNVFSPDGEGYNLGTWPPGQKRSYVFKKTGIYTQLCSLHPEMEGFVIVLQNSHFVVTRAGAAFKIPDVPDGHYELRVWGKKLKKGEREKSFPLDVKDGAAKVTLAF